MMLKLNKAASPTPVYYLAKISGLAPFTLKNKKLYPSHLLSNLIHPAIYLGIIAFMMSMPLRVKLGLYPETSSRLSQNVLLYRIIGRYSPWLITLIVLRLKYQSIIYVVEKLRDINKELKNISIEENYRKIFKSLFEITIITNVTVGTIFVVVQLFYRQSITEIIITVVDVCTRWNIGLCFSQVLHLMRQRFACLNKKLLDMLQSAHYIESPDCTRLFEVMREIREDRQTRRKDCAVLRLKIRKVEKLHFGFCNIVDRTSDIFGAPILLLNFNFLFICILFCDWIYKIVQFWRQPAAADDNFFNVNQIWLLLFDATTAFAGMFIITHASVLVFLQRSATKVTLIKIWNGIKPKKLRNQLLMFSLQLHADSTSIPTFGVLTLNYSLSSKMLGAAFVYVIVMAQIDTPS